MRHSFSPARDVEIEDLRLIFTNLQVEQSLVLKWQQVLLMAGLHVKEFQPNGMFTYAKTSRWDACAALMRDGAKWQEFKAAFENEKEPKTSRILDAWLKKNGVE